MILKLSKELIVEQLCKQLSSHFFFDQEEKCIIHNSIDDVLTICEENFRYSSNKYFVAEDGNVRFSPYHSVQYMIFLYYLSHYLFLHRKECLQLCDKIYYLNKILNSVDLFYAIELPSHFGAEHPLGAVMGRAKYSDGFFFYQGCTVGGTRSVDGNLYYPEIGKNVWMYANSSILGKCRIGDNVNIGAGAIVKNQDVPDNCCVFGESPNLIIKKRIK